MNKLAKEIREINSLNGFSLSSWNEAEIIRALALIHSEVSEALEELRKPNRALEPFFEELADIIIRTLDLSAAFVSFDIEKVVKEKMEKNRNRGHKHGKNF